MESRCLQIHMRHARWLTRKQQIFLVAYTGLVVSATKHGLGRHLKTISHADQVEAHRLLGTADFFVIISIAISKSSFAVTLLRLTFHTWHKALIWTIIITVNLLMWTTAIFIFTSCTPLGRVWDPTVPGTCWNSRRLLDYNVFSGGEYSFQIGRAHV